MELLTLSQDSSLGDILSVIKHCLDKLYTQDDCLFERNDGKGISERCLVFRFAHYLQNVILDLDLFVDCDFNSSFDKSGKPIKNPDGTYTRRFVDIIVHKRDNKPCNNFLCFEIKKWNNYKNRNKDRNNLDKLTTSDIYKYKYGFHIILGETKEKCKWLIFQSDSSPSDEYESIFDE